MSVGYCDDCHGEMTPVTHEEMDGTEIVVAHYCEDCGTAKLSQAVRDQGQVTP